MSGKKKGVIIGVDPHKMSVTIEVVDTHERLLGSGRFDTGGHYGATLQSSAADLHPLIDTSDQPLPGPAKPTLRPPSATRKTLLKAAP